MTADRRCAREWGNGKRGVDYTSLPVRFPHVGRIDRVMVPASTATSFEEVDHPGSKILSPVAAGDERLVPAEYRCIDLMSCRRRDGAEVYGWLCRGNVCCKMCRRGNAREPCTTLSSRLPPPLYTIQPLDDEEGRCLGCDATSDMLRGARRWPIYLIAFTVDSVRAGLTGQGMQGSGRSSPAGRAIFVVNPVTTPTPAFEPQGIVFGLIQVVDRSRTPVTAILCCFAVGLKRVIGDIAINHRLKRAGESPRS